MPETNLSGAELNQQIETGLQLLRTNLAAKGVEPGIQYKVCAGLINALASPSMKALREDKTALRELFTLIALLAQTNSTRTQLGVTLKKTDGVAVAPNPQQEEAPVTTDGKKPAPNAAEIAEMIGRYDKPSGDEVLTDDEPHVALPLDSDVTLAEDKQDTPPDSSTTLGD